MPNINQPVGRGGANRFPDVTTIQSLLNAVPPTAGGPRPPLAVDGVCGAMTNAAIASFQNFHFRMADGRVDPGRQTIAKLNEVAGRPGAGPMPAPTPGGAPAPAPAPVPGAGPNTAGLSPLRAKIIEIAMNEATPVPGKISDQRTMVDPATGETVREGWQHLKQFFDECVVNWSPAQWNNPANWNGVRKPGQRVGGGLHWCGIFATWVLRQAGVNAQWHLGTGIKPVTKIWGNKGVQAGDVGIIAHQAHHFVIVEIQGDAALSVNGNSDYQSIIVKKWPVSSIVAYHKVD